MNTMIRRLAYTVAALTLAAPVLAQPSPDRIGEIVSRAVEHATKAAEHAVRSGEWHGRTWAESMQAKQGPATTERIVKTFKVGPNGSLDLQAISGDVLVNEGGGDTITVEAIKSVRSRSAEEAKQQLANANVVMNQTGSRVEVRVQYSGRNNQAGVDFNVTAPAGTVVSAKSISGDVQVKNIKGEVRAESISGSVSCTGTPNVSYIKSVSGNLELAGLSLNGNLAISTISGSLQLRNIKAQSINAESVSGDVKLLDVTADRATVKSMAGDVEYAGPLARNGRYEMKTHSGDIRVTMPADVGFELDASSFSGEIRSDLPVTTTGATGARSAGRPGRHTTLHGTHGDGSALLTLNTFSGDVTVTKK